MRNKIVKRFAAVFAALMFFVALGMCIFSGTTSSAGAETISATRAYAVVQGYEWGPAVPKVVIEFPEEVAGVEDDTFSVVFTSYGGMVRTERTVVGAYYSDENGEEVEESGNRIAIEMTVKYNECSPFVYNMLTGFNTWATSIDFVVTVNDGKTFTVGNDVYEGGDSFSYSATEEDRVIPQTQSWQKDSYTYTDGDETITLQRASWAPEGAESDSGQNPLIIWLHGAGEGGTDIDITLLGNEVTALTTENETNVQYYFQEYGLAGAYVLAVQTPTMWMDKTGDGTYNNDSDTGKQESYYTEALWYAINDYVDNNPDIDTNRIYLGGCSNGGYMTMNMAFEYGDYFAAYYPICGAYQDARISDEMIESIKDYNIWFLQAENDTTVDPTTTNIPTFWRLLQAGAQNVHFTLTENVPATDDPSTGTYMGHWSWIIAFNDEVSTQFDNSSLTSEDDITAQNCTAEGNMWSWLAEQTKDGRDVSDYIGVESEQPETDGQSLETYWIVIIVVAVLVVVIVVVCLVVISHRKKK